MLTDVDGVPVKNIKDTNTDTSAQIVLIDEFIIELNNEIDGLGAIRSDILSQFNRSEQTIMLQHNFFASQQDEFNSLLLERGKYHESKNSIQKRLDEILKLLVRLILLYKRYVVDIDRLESIQKSGLVFMYTRVIPCPHCGANPDHQDLEKACDGDINSIINSATAKIIKIEMSLSELNNTVSDLRGEEQHSKKEYSECEETYQHLDKTARDTIAPRVDNFSHAYIALVDKKSETQRLVDLLIRRERLEKRKADLLDKSYTAYEKTQLETGPPNSAMYSLSLKISFVLKVRNFPGECNVFFDKVVLDLVIDDKPRDSREKRLRAIIYAAVGAALLEFCQKRRLPHPGFLALDPPLFAYYGPEDEDDTALQGTDLKEKLYGYLSKYHTSSSRIIVIESPHPPENINERITMTILTNNSRTDCQGLLQIILCLNFL